MHNDQKFVLFIHRQDGCGWFSTGQIKSERVRGTSSQYMHKGSGSFVGALGIEGYQIEQLSHPAPHAFPIAFFQFMGIEVGGAVGPNVVVDEQFISGEQDLTHHIAVLTIVSAGGFHPKVIKTKVLSIAIVLDEFETHMVEPKYNVPAWNHRIGSLMGHQIFQ